MSKLLDKIYNRVYTLIVHLIQYRLATANRPENKHGAAIVRG